MELKQEARNMSDSGDAAKEHWVNLGEPQFGVA